MKRTSVEVAVGIFVMIGIVSVAYLAVKLGKMELFGEGYYPVKARFTSVAGLTTGAEVEMAGVRIGKVSDISLDPKMKVAMVTFLIEEDISLAEDVIASVKTSGLIGDKYINIAPGGADEMIASGGMIMETESALDIESLISKYVFGGVE